jgi:hypothetical protein
MGNIFQSIGHPVPEEMLVVSEELRLKENEENEKREQLSAAVNADGELDKNLKSNSETDQEKELKSKRSSRRELLAPSYSIENT